MNESEDIHEELRRLIAGLKEPPGAASMKMSEVEGPSDPLRKIRWPVEGLPNGAFVFSTYDPGQNLHHVTLDVGGAQFHKAVSHELLTQAKDISAIASVVVSQLWDEASRDREAKYKALKLSYWKWLISDTVTRHTLETGSPPDSVVLSIAVYEDILQAEDDIVGGKVLRRHGGNRMKEILPTGMGWGTHRPGEAEALRTISVKTTHPEA